MDRIVFAADAAIDGDTLTGVAHTFGGRAQIGGVFHRFEATAFDRSLAERDVYAFYAHDDSKPLALKSAGTLRLAVENGQLRYGMDLGHRSYEDDLRESVARGEVRSMSFGVWPKTWKTVKDPDGVSVRLHTDSDLFEVSPVTMPAYTGTEAQLHSRGRETRESQIIRAKARGRRI